MKGIQDTTLQDVLDHWYAVKCIWTGRKKRHLVMGYHYGLSFYRIKVPVHVIEILFDDKHIYGKCMVTGHFEDRMDKFIALMVLEEM